MTRENLEIDQLFRWELLALYTVLELYIQSPELFDNEARVGIETKINEINEWLGKAATRPHLDSADPWA